MAAMMTHSMAACSSAAARRAPAGSSTSSARPLPRQQRRSVRVQARAAMIDDEEDTYKPTIDFPETAVKMGKRVGSGAYGLVFEGTLALPGKEEEKVILKKGKQSVNGTRFLRTEVAIARRLKGVKGVAPFLGVAGADSFLVWKHLGLETLEDFMGPRAEVLADIYDYWYEPAEDEPDWDERDELDFFKEFARKLITSASAIHSKGIIHRDIKPTNILITEGGEVLLIDLGAAADLKVGTNFAEDESVLDQLYGPPEQYVEFQRGNSLFFDLTWNKFQPDLFDSYSIGLVLMQVAVKYVRSREGLRRLRTFIDNNDSDLEMWRARQSSVAQRDFFLLDRDDGAGWEYIKRLVAPRNERMSVAKALKDPFLKSPMTKRMAARNTRN